ncbi:MAG TPA: type II toxin-antitoxin system prevent-host-death family antitoxin [Jatrophihabitantaceae bacterium]|jgi:prevent-host-death family protein
MATLTASEARARLPEILDRVEAGEEITITRHDKPVAVVLAPRNVRVRRAAAAAAIAEADELGQELERLRLEPLELSGAITAERAEEMVREIRADRDSD